MEQIDERINEIFFDAVDFITDPAKDGRFINEDLNMTCSKAFEILSCAYLSTYTNEYFCDVVGTKGDNGIDIVFRGGIAQCKKGKFFSSGKGPTIVREFAGSLVLAGYDDVRSE